MQPRPSVRNSYCTICKLRFDDYKDHINSTDHIFKMRQSPYNELILQMCGQYARETGLLIYSCTEESDLETNDRREFFERRKTSEEQK